MWLLNDPPPDRLKAQYGFELTDAWLEHARLASVRFNNGGSGLQAPSGSGNQPLSGRPNRPKPRR